VSKIQDLEEEKDYMLEETKWLEGIITGKDEELKYLRALRDENNWKIKAMTTDMNQGPSISDF